MTILEDGETPPRRTQQHPASNASTMSLSPFPPRSFDYPQHYHQAAPPPSNQSTESLLPYAFRHAQPTAFEQYPEGSSGQSPLLLLNWRQRGFKLKVLVILAGASIIFLLHDHFFRRRGPPHHGPPSWAHGRPFGFPPGPDGAPPPDMRLDEFGRPYNHADVHQTTTLTDATTHSDQATSTSTTAKADSTELPLLDAKLFTQPRRAIRPAYPDPWHDLPKNWNGREWLSEDRFPGDGKGMSDPPERDPPPARYLAKAFEFAAAAAKHLTQNHVPRPKAAPLPLFDEQTGRPKQVPHEEVYIHQGGWKGPKLKVSEIKGGKMPKVQWEGELPGGEEGERAVEEGRRRAWVKRAFLHAWEGYKKHAWGHDELMPLSNLFSNNYNGWGATIVDNLDTLLIMNLSHEYNLAREHVSQIDFAYLAPSGSLTFSTDLPDLEKLDLPESGPLEPQLGAQRFVNPRLASAMNQHSPTTLPHFETTIRYLGGMLSAYDLSGDPLMLERATELGDWLLPSLGTMYGLAINRYMLGSNPAGLNTGRAVLSEVGSLTMEFTRLSMLTGNEIYYQAVQRSMDTLDQLFPAADAPPVSGRNRGRLGTLLPAWLDPSHPDIMSGEYTYGGLADSYYEYLIKQAQLTCNAIPQYSRMYAESTDSAYEHLIRHITVVPGRDDLSTIGLAQWGMYSSTLEHLTCFAGGMLGLGARLLEREADLQTGINVTEACAWAYESTETGLGPETLVFYEPEETARYIAVETEDGLARKPRGAPVLGVKNSNAKFIGRPETIESIFYQWRLTGDRKWQDRGWQMFTSWMEHAITESGFASLNNVHLKKPKLEDSMESFVLAETLKYYYLLFSPRDLISLDDYVFNTEAHPFLIPKTSRSSSPNLWTGPDEFTTAHASFASTVGEGTWVQKFARVQQAAGLLHPSSKTLSQGKVPGGAPVYDDEKPPAVRKPIRPSEDELEQARKAAGPGAGAAKDVGAEIEAKKKEEERKKLAVMGGGRGMGGGGAPRPV